MITLSVDICNPISQKIYNDIISSLQFHQLSCPCGHSGCLIGHGYYNRYIKADGNKVSLKICRVKCKICNTTHALLLASIVPYSQISLEDQIDIVSSYTQSEEGSSVMERNSLIDENNIKSIIRQYRQHWQQRLISEKIPLSPVFDLVKQCFSFLNRQFMQIKCTPNILFLRPT